MKPMSKSLLLAATFCAVALPVRAQDAEALRAMQAPANAIWVETLDLSKMSSEWQRPQAAKSIGGNTITLKGIAYAHGIGTHASSEMAIDLFGEATRFESMVGVDDEATSSGSVTFEVYVDGKKVEDSSVLKGGGAPKLLSVDLAGARRMVLRVTDAEDSIDNDHADWAGAMLVLAPTHTKTPRAVDAPPIVPPLANEPPLPIFSYANPSPLPAIHGPRVTGATPGRPFLFLIPATGQGPLTYAARNLPAGLNLDPRSGIISGSLQNAGTFLVKLMVKGPRGSAQRNLAIVGGTHKLSQTPPMGWNSWNIYYCGVDEKKVRDAAAWIVKTGLQRHGYQYVNIDDCWQAERNAAGEMQVNPKFGDLKVLGDNLHAQGFKFGIYSSPGPKTCAGYSGSYGHEPQDALSYTNWGVDYLKHDWCSYGDVATGEGLERLKKPYRTMRQALDTAGRDIVYSLCQYGMGNVSAWGDDPAIKGNLWRTTGDIGPSYRSMSSIGFSQSGLEKYAGPGHWNDPDMLFVHALKPNEQITHLSLWSLLAAPLLIGSDISKLDQYAIDALSNDEVIEVDQDPLGIQASRRAKDGSLEVWARPLWDGTLAVGLFNRGRVQTSVSAKWADLGLRGAQPVRDLWRRRDVGVFRDALNAVVPAHGAVLVKIGKPRFTDYAPARF